MSRESKCHTLCQPVGIQGSGYTKKMDRNPDKSMASGIDKSLA
jgi:hypothetical protein